MFLDMIIFIPSFTITIYGSQNAVIHTERIFQIKAYATLSVIKLKIVVNWNYWLSLEISRDFEKAQNGKKSLGRANVGG